MEQLEQRIRRSSKLKDRSTFRELLAYASMVRDEDEVFSYMEENKIGLDEPQFWTAKLNMLRNRCQYREFVKVLKVIAKNRQLQQHPKYWLINEAVNDLEKYLQRLLRQKAKGKRTAKEYEVLNFKDVQKQTRKFGKIQVYVDPDCRMQYRLENLTEFVCRRLSEQCDTARNIYERDISSKPLSFIGKAKDKINKISLEIFDFRKQYDEKLAEARKKSGRISLVGRKSNKGGLQLVETPDFKKKSFSKESRKKKEKIERDSFQIYKSCQKKSTINSLNKQQQQEVNPEFEIASSISSVKKQKIRKSPDRQSESIFSEADTDVKQNFAFSFGDDQQNMSQQNREVSKSSSKRIKSRSERQKKINFQHENVNDIAFIEETNQNSINIEGNKMNQKNTLDLENIIKQIQMQKYDSQTFSEIDSNKENNLFFSEDSWGVNLNPIESMRNLEMLDKDRKKFETIKKGQHDSYHKKNQRNTNMNQSSGSKQQMNESSQLIYTQLLTCLDGNSQNENQPSMSQRKKKKRISRISQERSYSFSETRPRSKSNT